MHLKSLTMRGFKSFAAATTFTFEPGITCVVGPNGSGKSNVVDALAWVMGEQGARSLRGAKMEDVVFAGTSGRAPLGRAEVSLTIDNSDGALPIDYTEVTIARTMFRNGGSEYAINGASARLLDVQELLSDSGIGREMHVIVGQGQLDSVLAASPQERRGFIEEAAGVLKHRKRKEKALRKLEAMQANLVRVQDLTIELRRQLKPLGRQAELAKRAASLQADLRDARLRLLADDLVSLTAALEDEVADETALRAQQADLQAGLARAQQREADAEAAGAVAAPRLAQAQETWHRLSALQERFRATSSLAGERLRHLAAEPDDDQHGADPDTLDAEAADIRFQQRALAAGLQHDHGRLSRAVRERSGAEAALAAEEKRLADVARAAADRREGLARLTGQVAAKRSRLEAGESEQDRLAAAIEQARARAADAAARYTAVESRVAGLDEGEEGLDAEHERAAAALAGIESRRAALTEQEREAERDRAAATARAEALSLGLDPRDAAPTLLERALPGVLGPVASLLTVQPGYESAVAAALGAAADAVAVADVHAARAALLLLKERDAGQASLLVARPPSARLSGPEGDPAGAAEQNTGAAMPALQEGERRAVEVLDVSGELAPALHRLLARVVVVDDLDAAVALLERVPLLTAVTRAGDVLGPALGSGGSDRAPSLLEVQAAVDEAREWLAAATSRGERLRFALAGLEEERSRAADEVEDALNRLYDSDARHAAVAEELGHLGGLSRASTAEAERLAARARDVEHTLAGERAALAELEVRLHAAEAAAEAPAAVPGGPTGDTVPGGRPADEQDRDRLAAAATAARAAEVEARLAARTTEERAAALSGRAESLEHAARRERDRRARLASRRAHRAGEAARARAVAAAAAATLEHLAVSLRSAAAEREAAEQFRGRQEGELLAVRAEVRHLSAQLETLLQSAHRDEVARIEQQLRIETLQERARTDFGVEPVALAAEYGPAVPVPAPEQDASGPRPYVRAEQEARRDGADRALAVLGRVNPLALEEYAALEERQRFLSEQLDDLKATRRDLLDIVAGVDERVDAVFAAAFEDTARAFEAVFARLFPGGEGRLVLTDPDDLRASGIEVEARPPGKKIRRLSLLSGGERSLTAVALLVAIFQARPSPFYVLDEVEAALDDTNLSRLLNILVELRESSQLIVITHQKRTMEIANALYGVSMRGDGISAVISSRLPEAESA